MFTHIYCVMLKLIFSQKVRDDEPFIDTLDYIFVSDGWQVNSVKKLPLRNEVNGPLPTENEPSDHILIAADLSLD